MQQVQRRSTARDQLDRWVPRGLLLLVALAMLARLWLVFRRLYDPDELQHLHAGFCVWRGMVPYRDFFEQHQPVLWYLSLPLFGVWGASLKVLFAGRMLIWIIGSITVGLTWYAGNRFFGRFAGPIAALLLVMHPPYQEKNVEWRPDNVAVPLMLAAVLCLDRALGPRDLRWTALAGMLFATGFFCTQKVVYAALGMNVAYMGSILARRRAGSNLAGSSVAPREASLAVRAIALALGAAVIVVTVLGFFYHQGALGPFLRLTLIAPLEWQTREPISHYVINQLSSGTVLWAAGVAGCVLVACECFGRAGCSPGAAMIAGGAVTHTVGLAHVPAAFHQYYLPLSPLVALLGAHALAVLAQWSDSPVQRTGKILAVVAGLAAASTALTARSLVIVLSPSWIPLLAGLLAVAALLAFFRLYRPGVLLALVVAAVGAFAYHRVQFFQWSNEHQTRRIEQLMAATEPDDAFFDGFTGYGALRPHAFYYYWINHHSWPMIPVADKRGGVLAALTDPRTRVVLLDQNLTRHLPHEALQVIERNYVPDARYSDFPAMVVCIRPR